MKKQILMAASALILAAGIAGGMSSQEVQAASKKVAINKKNFPDQVFRELVKANYDKNKDKKLSSSEIKKAKKFGSYSCKTSVKIKSSKYGKYTKKYVKDIKNFKGIEKLTALQKFVANGTSVKTVKLKKNKNLTYLEMTDGKLQKLDLNSNKKLKYVYLEYNQLTSLKMNKCKKLRDVNLTGHMVKKLKIDRNKKTEVIGEEYYAPYKATKVKAAFNEINDGGMIDPSGNYCIYEWAADNSSCVKKTVNGSQINSTPIALDANTVNKTKAIQKITAQWQDAQGNFFFVADKDGDMVEQTVYYIYKINAQGAIESETKLNDQILVNKYDKHFSMKYLGQNNGVIILGVISKGNHSDGVVYFDTASMTATKQATCDFIPETADGDIIAGAKRYDSQVVVSKIANGTKEKLEDGKEIEVFKLGSGHKMDIPIRDEDEDWPYAMQIHNNYLYLISGQGFFKAKLTANKFTQLYGISKLSGMQDPTMKYKLTIKNEKEIYLLSNQTKDEKTTYSLQVGTIA